MIGFLYRLLVGRFHSCSHEWETLDAYDVVAKRGDLPVHVEKHLRCKKCGDWKRVRL